MADNEEASLVEQALEAVRSGNAGSWPTVAGYLAEEVERLRERRREVWRVRRHYEAGVDATPRDEGAQMTPGQLWHSLLTSDVVERLNLLEGLLANTEQSRECFMQDHRGQIEMMSFDLQDVQARLSATFGFETPQSLHALTVATQALRNIMVAGIASRVVEEVELRAVNEDVREADSVKVIDDAFERAGIDVTARCDYEWGEHPENADVSICYRHLCGLINPMHAQAHECSHCGVTLSHEDAERLATQ